MKKVLGALASMLVLAIHTPADAAVITVLDPGVLSNGSPVATFESQTQTPYGSTTPTGSFIDGAPLSLVARSQNSGGVAGRFVFAIRNPGPPPVITSLAPSRFIWCTCFSSP